MRKILSLAPLFIVIIILLSSLMPLNNPAKAIEIENPLEADTFEELIEAIINLIFNIALVVAPMMIILGGFLFITAGGSPERVEQAKKIIFYALAGLIIIFLAKGIIALLKEIFLKPSP